MATRRTKSVSTKVTDAEYELLAAAAAPLTISEWARSALLGSARTDRVDFTLLSEVLALRVIVLNLHFALAERRSVTAEDMHVLIDRADAEKLSKAEDRIATLRTDSHPASK